MPDKPNAHVLAQVAREVSVLRSASPPGPETGDGELGTDVIPDILYELREREVTLVLAPVGGGELLLLCGIAGSH